MTKSTVHISSSCDFQVIANSLCVLFLTPRILTYSFEVDEDNPVINRDGVQARTVDAERHLYGILAP